MEYFFRDFKLLTPPGHAIKLYFYLYILQRTLFCCKALWTLTTLQLLSEPFYTGGQPDDDRIVVEESTVHAPAYTEGESFWRKSTITISKIKRPDDGLYECQAENEGGRHYKSGHITVEFGPTFEDQLYNKEWSWDQRPIQLSCIGEKNEENKGNF